MTGQLLQLAASLAAILALVAFAHFLGFSRSSRLESEANAKELLRLAVGGFEPKNMLLDAEGEGALGRDAQGRLAVLKPHGNQFVARPLTRSAILVLDNGKLQITDAPLGSRPLVLRIDNTVPAWVAALVDAR